MNDYNKNDRKEKRKKDYTTRQLTPFGKLICFIIFGFILYSIINICLPNFKTMPFYEYYEGSKKDSINIVVEDKFLIIENNPVYRDEEVYIPVDFVKDYIDKYIFWDNSEKKLTITTANNVIRMQTEELTYYVNNDPMELDMPIYNIEEIAYMPKSTLEDIYNISLIYNDKSGVVTLDYTDREYYLSNVISKRSAVRYEPDKKSPIVQKISKDDEVRVFEEDGKYTKIRTPDGFVGWTLTKNLGEKTIILSKEKTAEKPADLWKPTNGKINMIFDQMQNVSANSSEKRRIVHNGLDVISPTWFSFKNKDGDIKNIADKNYVEWAHSNGYQVWGLITDNFDASTSHAILSSTKNREHVIKQILAYAAIYDLDGINIDFEAVPTSDGEYFVQFIRELGPLLHKQGDILSIDTFVPKSWTKHYNRGEISKIADYIIVMGYDEHYRGSKTSGSVASISWSNEAIESSLAEGVPKEKLILGVPYYARVWEEKEIEGGGIDLSSRALGMQDAYDDMKERNAEFVWLEEVGQYYAEVIQEDVTYKLWLEDEKSLEERLKLVKEYDIAGCAGWKRGFEKDEIWSVLKKYLKG